MYQIIIADDEELECKVLEKMIGENYPEVKVLPSASNGIELIAQIEQEIPDIAVVDINMPGLNGLDAVEIIRSRHSEIKILIISAYSKFEYAKKALTLGASDYLLKPVKEKVFLDTIQKLFDAIDLEKQKQKETLDYDMMLQNYRSAMEDEFMSNLILEAIPEQNLQKYKEILPQPFAGAYIAVVQLLSDTNASQIYWDFLSKMKTICNCMGKIQKNSLTLCMFSSSFGSLESHKADVTENLECIRKKYPKSKKFLIGVSSFQLSIEELSKGVQESHLSLFEVSSPGIYFWESKKSNPSFYKKKDYLLLIKQKHYKELIKLLQQLIQKASSQNEPLINFQIYLLDLMHTIFEEIPYKKTLFSFPEFITWIYWEKILSQKNYSDLYDTIHWLLDHYLNCPDTEILYHRHIVNSLSFISEHYMEDLTLDAVAAQNEISSFYLSRMFKQKLDHTFLELLTDIRISKALDMLYSKDCSAQEISEKCGYLNTSYFYKLFKKQTGLTVKKMRSLIYLFHHMY